MAMAEESTEMDLADQWQIGRRYGQGLWLASDLRRAVEAIASICHLTGYRRRDVCVWRHGVCSPAFWVSEPRGQGGVGAASLDEAIALRVELETMGQTGRQIRPTSRFTPLTVKEAAILAGKQT